MPSSAKPCDLRSSAVNSRGPGPVLVDLAEAVFVSIDIQPRAHRVWTAENRHPDFVRDGFDPDDLNAAERHFQETALPNALRLAAWARRSGLPRIFVHWAGGGPENRPHDRFELFPEDQVVPKTMRDAFPSSDFGQILERLGRRTLLLVGGHTQGCLGQTARSALERGYRCVLVRDASFDCSLLRWPKGIAAVNYDLVLETEEVLRLGQDPDSTAERAERRRV